MICHLFVCVTEGDATKFTLHDPGMNIYPHSMDFHAAEIEMP